MQYKKMLLYIYIMFQWKTWCEILNDIKSFVFFWPFKFLKIVYFIDTSYTYCYIESSIVIYKFYRWNVRKS